MKTRLITAVGVMAVLSLFIPALFLAYVVVFQKIWTREDVRSLIRLKTLGTLAWNEAAPAAARKRSDDAERRKGGKDHKDRKSGKDRKDAGSGAKPGAPGAADGAALPDGFAPHPLVLFYGNGYTLEDLEAYRLIREEVESHFRSADDSKYCLLITSTRPNEGKTTMSCNLAMTFARKGKRTLLIDADFRLGRVSQVFNLPAATGLDELLGQQDMSDAQFIEAASMCFQPTMQRNLVLAPRNRANPNASELVSSDRFKAFILLAREQFDVVLIDSPPIMITPEPLALTEVVDGVIFVCLSGGTVVSEAREASEILLERGAKVGVVVNGVRSSPFEQNRYKKYSYYYQAQPKPSEQAGA